jgi:hypothetical protein
LTFKAIAAGCPVDSGTISTILHSFVEAGVLQLWKSAPSAQDDALPISTIAIVTADRPDSFERCFRSYCDRSGTDGNVTRLLIVDGSQTPSNADRVRIIGQTGPKGLRTQYVGTSESAQLRADLTHLGFARPSLDFGLSAGLTGANRNIVLALTAGEGVLMVDDDVVLKTWTTVQSEERLMVVGHGDHRGATFFADRSEAVRSAAWGGGSITCVHERLLGRPLGSLFAQFPFVDSDNACGHILQSACTAESRVRATMTGILGDTGFHCPYRMLFGSGPLPAHLMWDDSQCQLALHSRECQLIAPCYIVAHTVSLMATCMGVANWLPLPPFMPRGRNQDGVFGATVSCIDRSASFGHVPLGVVHDSARDAGYETAFASARGLRLADIMFAALSHLWPYVEDPEPWTSLRRLGKALSVLGASNSAHFEHVIREATVRHRTDELRKAFAELEANRYCAETWRSSVEQYAHTLMLASSSDSFVTPEEFSHSNRSEALTATQRYIGAMGDLCSAWPDIIAELRTRRIS